MTKNHLLLSSILTAFLFVPVNASAFWVQSNTKHLRGEIGTGITCCTTINTSTISGGLLATVDLANVKVFTPVPGYNGACKNTSNTSLSNYLASVVPNTSLPSGVVPRSSWAASTPGVRLLINANFFYLTANPYYTDCLDAIGYSVNQGRFSSVYNQVHGADTTSLVFYTKLATGGKYAGLVNYFAQYSDVLSDTGATTTVIRALRPDNSSVGYAVSGFQFLKNGAYIEQPAVTASETRPRTVVGLTDDGRYLKIIVVNPGDDSKGAALPDLVTYLKGLGITNALNLDGSGSSQLYFPELNIKSAPSDVIDNSGQHYYRPVPVFLGFQ